jgi:hypothetical protein
MMPATATAERISKLLQAPLPKHGTRARNKRGCKCLKCRSANSEYVAAREAARKERDTRDIVSAELARAHIVALGKAGVGYKIVADEAMVAPSIVFAIRRGKRTQIRAHTERAILAVDAKAVLRGDAALIDGRETWKLLDELLADGYSKTQLAKWLGSTAKVPALQLQRDQVTFRSAVAVRDMYSKVKGGFLRRDR